MSERGVRVSILGWLLFVVANSGWALTTDEAVEILIGSNNKKKLEEVYVEYASDDPTKADELLQDMSWETFQTVPKPRLMHILVASSLKEYRFTAMGNFERFEKADRPEWMLFFARVEVEKSRRRFRAINNPPHPDIPWERREGLVGRVIRIGLGGSLVIAASFVDAVGIAVMGGGVGLSEVVRNSRKILTELRERRVDRLYLENLVAVLNFIYATPVIIEPDYSKKLASALGEAFSATRITYPEHLDLLEAYERLFQRKGIFESKAALSHLRDVEHYVRCHPNLQARCARRAFLEDLKNKDEHLGSEVGIKYDPGVDVMKRWIFANVIQEGAWVINVPDAWRSHGPDVRNETADELKPQDIEKMLPVGLWIRYPAIDTRKFFLIPLGTNGVEIELTVTKDTGELEVWVDPWSPWSERLGSVPANNVVSQKALGNLYANYRVDKTLDRVPFGARQLCKLAIAKARKVLGTDKRLALFDER